MLAIIALAINWNSNLFILIAYWGEIGESDLFFNIESAKISTTLSFSHKYFLLITLRPNRNVPFR